MSEYPGKRVVNVCGPLGDETIKECVRLMPYLSKISFLRSIDEDAFEIRATHEMHVMTVEHAVAMTSPLFPSLVAERVSCKMATFLLNTSDEIMRRCAR